MDCNQKGCSSPAAYRYTWPGTDEAGICEAHAEKAKAIASAMGLHLQMIPLEPEPGLAPELEGPTPDCETCRQIREVYEGYGPSHDGSSRCRCGSIASGGTKAHCTCRACF